MKQLYVEVLVKNKKETIEYKGRFKIFEDNKDKALIHQLFKFTVDWEIENLAKQLGFKDARDCLQRSMNWVIKTNKIKKFREEVHQFGMPVFSVNKYKKKILKYE